MNGNTGYCIKSLKVLPANLLSSVRYSKLVISPCLQLQGDESQIQSLTIMIISSKRDIPLSDLLELFVLSLSAVIQVGKLKLQELGMHIITFLINKRNTCA